MKRNSAIDLAKGIAISLMVIGHCYSTSSVVNQVISAFHMPFFFVVSGMLYAEKWNAEARFDFKKTAKKLLIPYFVFQILFALFITVLSRKGQIIQQMKNCLLRILPLVGMSATWFLPCLLIAQVLFVITHKISVKKIRIAVRVLLMVLGLFVSVPWSLNAVWRALVGMGFFCVGFYGKRVFLTKCKNIVLGILMILFLAVALINEPVDMSTMRYGNRLLYLTGSVIGSYLLMQICMRLQSVGTWAWMQALGRDSVIVLCLHVFVIEIIRLLDSKVFGNVFPRMGVAEGIILGGIVVFVVYLMIPACNRWFGVLFGKSGSRKNQVEAQRKMC